MASSSRSLNSQFSILQSLAAVAGAWMLRRIIHHPNMVAQTDFAMLASARA
jgi:hypothetical protein